MADISAHTGQKQYLVKKMPILSCFFIKTDIPTVNTSIPVGLQNTNIDELNLVAS